MCYSHSGMQKIKRRRGSESPLSLLSSLRTGVPTRYYRVQTDSIHRDCLLLPVTDFELELTPAAGRVFFLSDGLTFLRRSKYSPLCTINEIKHLFTEIIHATVGKARDHFSLSLRSLVNCHPKVLSRKQGRVTAFFMKSTILLGKRPHKCEVLVVREERGGRLESCN